MAPTERGQRSIVTAHRRHPKKSHRGEAQGSRRGGAGGQRRPEAAGPGPGKGGEAANPAIETQALFCLLAASSPFDALLLSSDLRPAVSGAGLAHV